MSSNVVLTAGWTDAAGNGLVDASGILLASLVLNVTIVGPSKYIMKNYYLPTALSYIAIEPVLVFFNNSGAPEPGIWQKVTLADGDPNASFFASNCIVAIANGGILILNAPITTIFDLGRYMLMDVWAQL